MKLKHILYRNFNTLSDVEKQFYEDNREKFELNLCCLIISPFFLFKTNIEPNPVVIAKTLSFTANPPLIMPLDSSTFFFNFFTHFFFQFI